MSKRNRIFAGILLAYAVGLGVLVWQIMEDIEPRYRESAEDSLVETSHLVAGLIEQQSREGALDLRLLRPAFESVYAQRLSANIYGHEKTQVDLRLIVVDRLGTVLFDSLKHQEGRDFSKWRDIRLALEGKYGARTSKDTEGDPDTSVMFVAAPIKIKGQIVGAVSIGKPVPSLGPYVAGARRETLLIGITSVISVLLLVLILSVWLVRPFGFLSDYFRYVRAERDFDARKLWQRAVSASRAAFDEMRDTLAGRSYVADYVETLTHEIKSPLSTIRGATELLHDLSMAPDDRRRFLTSIDRETRRIQELIDRMMELSALESRRGLENVVSVSLRPMLQELVAAAEAAGAARQLRFQLDAPTDAEVKGDALLIRRAVSNLIDNAIDFSPQGGTIRVGSDVARRTVEVSVRDEGPGIPDFAGERVFEKFYSLARPHSGRKSTGLGLAFVKQIAVLHEGKASLENNMGRSGATARLTLPRVAGSSNRA